MVSLSSLFCAITGCSTPAGGNADSLRAALSKDNIGIISASCCDASAPAKDEALKANVSAAMKATGDKRAVAVETITTAQKYLRGTDFHVGAGEKQLVESVMSLFQSSGMAIFPLLIVDGKLASYGGVPSVEQIKGKLLAHVQPAGA